MRSIKIEEIFIEVIKKDIKNINLSVLSPNGRVRISVPKKMDDEAIKIFALTKLAWIRKQKSKFKLQDKEIIKEFLSGESHYFFGNKYILNILETKEKQHIQINNNKEIDIYVRKNSTKEKREKLMDEWYRAELKKIIPDYIKKWEPIIDVKVEEFGVKKMKTRWGTCNVAVKRIWINLELAKKNHRYLEYLIVHEMIHLLERNHNDRFKAYMDKFLPEWRSIKAELNGLI